VLILTKVTNIGLQILVVTHIYNYKYL
jgi:hypothetical protein